jgi:hypothetical protein
MGIKNAVPYIYRGKGDKLTFSLVQTSSPKREMQKLVEIVATEKEAEKLACRS